MSVIKQSDSLKESKQVGRRGKPTRKVSTAIVHYEISHAEYMFRFDSCCAIIQRKHPSISHFQVKVLLAIQHLLKWMDVPSISYCSIDTAGCIRGMRWQDIVRSLHLLHEARLVEPFGMTKGGKHHKYRLSYYGDETLAWMDAELTKPSDTINYQSKMFGSQSAA